MAWNFGQIRGLAAACLGVGAACLGGAALTLLASPAAAGVLLGLLIAYGLFLVATSSIFALPAYFMQHARRDFRAAILADAQLRSALEAMSPVWTDPVGFREFGPLELPTGAAPGPSVVAGAALALGHVGHH